MQRPGMRLLCSTPKAQITALAFYLAMHEILVLESRRASVWCLGLSASPLFALLLDGRNELGLLQPALYASKTMLWMVESSYVFWNCLHSQSAVMAADPGRYI
eukprot:646452-Pleurochrysis_carterae.AAC.3